MKHIHVLAIIAVFAGTVAPVTGITQPTMRTIGYDPEVPIADRLVAGDVNVVVKKLLGAGDFEGPPAYKETFEEETRRLSSYETIVVVKIPELEGHFSDKGTWIRSRIRAEASDVLKRGTLVNQSGSIDFWEDGGTIKVGSATVTALDGLYPAFRTGQRYLIFLRTDRNRGTAYAAMAFHLNPQGIVEAMQRNDGRSIVPWSSLIGRSVSELNAAFARPK